LASHAERGGVWDKAAHYLVEALAQTAHGFAYHEANALYDRTLGALKHLPPSTSSPLAVRARVLMFNPLVWFGELERLLEITREAEALACALGDKRQLAWAKVNLATISWIACKHEAGLQSSEEALRLANELDDFSLRFVSRFAHAELHHAKGALREASNLFTQVIDSLSGELEMRRFGYLAIPSVIARTFLTWSLVSLGEFERARQTMSHVMERVPHFRDPYTAAYAYISQGLYQSATGKPKAAVIESFEAANRFRPQADSVLQLLLPWLGVAYTEGGRPADALALLLEAERNGTYGSGNIHSWFHHHVALAQAHLAMGALPLAQAAIGRAEEIAEGAQAPAYLAAAVQIHGSVAATDPAMKADGICAIYQRAIDIARPCGMRPLIAQCLTGMAQVHEAAGDIAAATDYDIQARQLFDEMGMPPDSPMRRQ
jgi:tetratricopeptide (TPR) repeat protein